MLQLNRGMAAVSTSQWSRGLPVLRQFDSGAGPVYDQKDSVSNVPVLPIHDEGALPFVISARIEAAAKRAGPWDWGAMLRLNRSPCRRGLHVTGCGGRGLYLPGSEPKYFINAAIIGRSAVILDSGGFGTPTGEKDTARILVRNALRAVDFGKCERMVRINQLPMGLEDLAEIVPESPDLVLSPGVERPEHVAETDRMIGELKNQPWH